VDACAVKADVSDPVQVKEMFSVVKKDFGKIDVLVNSAGWTTYIDIERIESVTEAVLQKVVDVNIKGVFLCCRESFDLLKKGRDALIVNISSTSGLTGMGSNIIYSASKAAVISLTKTFAKAYAPEVRVNSLAPGYVDTGFISQIPREIIDEEQRLNPMGRIADVIDIANAAFSMYSRMRYVTGQVIVIDGGRSL
jgi:3-oxoacyl-[acyl-carrier protein] reductase